MSLDSVVEFSECFSESEKTAFLNNGISPSEANTFEEVKRLSFLRKIMPRVTFKRRTYSGSLDDFLYTEINVDFKEKERFNTHEIIFLIQNGISYEQAITYPKKFEAYEIVKLSKSQKPLDQVLSFHPVFSVEDIIELLDHNISSDIANSFPTIFGGDNIRSLILSGITYDGLQKYHSCLKDKYRVQLVRQNISPQDAEKYIQGFLENPKELFRILRPKKLLSRIFSGKIDVNQVLAERIIALSESKLSPEVANSYKNFVNGSEIINLYRSGIMSHEANLYDSSMDYISLTILYRMGIKPSNLKEYQQKLSDVMKQIANSKIIKYSSFKLQFVGCGNNAIILLNNSLPERLNYVLKFSLDTKKEYNLLRMLEAKHNGSYSNVVHISKTKTRSVKRLRSIVIPLEFISGKSLDNLICNSELDTAQIKSYSHDVLKGLIELRQAGIYHHRDIRPANIIVDNRKDKAVIIDLGLATTDEDALQVDNRRFGAYKLANDLNSLGQLMYYMATGTHIFSQSVSQTTSMSDIAYEIADYRTQVYSDNTGKLLSQHLAQADTTINDTGLRDIIKQCLVAKPNDHDKIMKMFEEYKS
jgi:serine/threonine protein kinase